MPPSLKLLQLAILYSSQLSHNTGSDGELGNAGNHDAREVELGLLTVVRMVNTTVVDICWDTKTVCFFECCIRPSL